MYQTADLSLRSQVNYAIYTGDDILGEIAGKLAEHFDADRLAVVIDHNVYQLHGNRIQQQLLNSYEQVAWYVVPAGEESKSYKQWRQICDRMLEERVRRTTPLVAIGGGVTGDLAGFAAATILRGIPLIHLPTTLLAMVDSSIGGKTGINHRTGKNLIGSFYQPQAVYADLSFLETLQPGEWVNGLSEILKYGAIADRDIIAECVYLTGDHSFRKPLDWWDTINKSMSVKARIVEKDEKEAGIRAHLNFGHTFAHALESLTEYGRFSHGEAVFVGMHAALYASNELGASLDGEALRQFNNLYSLDVSGLEEKTEALIDRMYYDKKVRKKSIRLVLLQDWGHPYVTVCEDHDLLKQAWQYALDQF